MLIDNCMKAISNWSALQMAWNVFCQTKLYFWQKSSHNHTWWLSVSCWNAIAMNILTQTRARTPAMCCERVHHIRIYRIDLQSARIYICIVFELIIAFIMIYAVNWNDRKCGRLFASILPSWCMLSVIRCAHGNSRETWPNETTREPKKIGN